ncbi:MAG: 50S ribosomal protein L6 [Thermoanaerobaculia bacterium]|nr:50S ribosomal protein L6 [Thermoanaerobaculia bacterium]
MSRVGRMSIPISKGVKVKVEDGVFTAEGPKGKVSEKLLDGIVLDIQNDEIQVQRGSESRSARSQHGLMRSLVANAVQGVHEGFSKRLDIVGVGYRGEVKGSEVHLALGYSHPVIYAVPKGIEVAIEKNVNISVSGADRQQVGQVAAELRGLRPPDAYKGKGIRYADEQLRLKVGKTGA